MFSNNLSFCVFYAMTRQYFTIMLYKVQNLKCYEDTPKAGHDPHSFQLGDNFYAVSSSLILVWPLWVRITESLQPKLLIVLFSYCFV